MQPSDRYKCDPVFKNLVDMLQHYLGSNQGTFTPTELREAVLLATTLYENRVIRPLIFNPETNQMIEPVLSHPRQRMGEKLRIKKGWHNSGKVGSRVGPDVQLRGPGSMMWTPILWDGEEDPDFHKAPGLERANDFHV